MNSLKDLFEQGLSIETSSKSKEYKPKFAIKPSMIGSKCFRKIYYSTAGVIEDYGFDNDGKKRLLVGDAIHNVISDVLSKTGQLIDYVNPDGSVHRKFGFADETKEFPLQCDELYIKHAYVDAVVVLDGKLWLGEYKSINLKGFESLMAPKADHIVQAVVYWYVFNMKLQAGEFSHIDALKQFSTVTGVRWLYFNKDNHSMKEFHLETGDSIFEEIVNKIMTIKDAYTNKQLPPKTPEFCNSCNWRDKCKKNYNIP
jgi:CRISPR/Cas system-associated exonuclease Cas4 (RecB family)